MDTSSAGYTKTSVGQDQIGLGVASNINQMVSIYSVTFSSQSTSSSPALYNKCRGYSSASFASVDDTE